MHIEMGEMHPKKRERERERNVCACLLHSIWHMLGVNLFGRTLDSDHYTAEPRAVSERVSAAVAAGVDPAQGMHAAKCELCTYHPEKLGPFPKGSEDRPHTHGNSVCAFLPSGTGAQQE